MVVSDNCGKKAEDGDKLNKYGKNPVSEEKGCNSFNIKICPSCNKENHLEAIFCKECGLKFESPEESPQTQENEDEEKNKLINKPLIILGAVALTVFFSIVGLISYSVFFGGNLSKEKINTVATNESTGDSNEITNENANKNNNATINLEEGFIYNFIQEILENKSKLDNELSKEIFVPTDNYKVYTNDLYRFNCPYPDNFKEVDTDAVNIVQEFRSPGGSILIFIGARENSLGQESEDLLNEYIGSVYADVEYRNNGKGWYAVSLKDEEVIYYRKCLINQSSIIWFDVLTVENYLDYVDDYIEYMESNFKRIRN